LGTSISTCKEEDYKIVGNFVYAGGVWFFIYSVVDGDNEDGFWKTKGEPCKIDSDSMTIGWITTLEFYEGQAPHERKTKWVMQEYRISQGGWCEGSNVKVFRGIC
jgi:hypothetical protein